MAISKKIREQVYKKYSGHCAYCGCKIDYKDMQIDHIVPKMRLKYAECSEQEIECLDNYMPACRSCNHYKSSFSLEAFRRNIADLIRTRKYDAMNKIAERFGIITFHKWDKKFYFEKREVDK